jgi:hypothetical protein
MALAHYDLGSTLDALGDAPGALTAYRQALAIDPQFAPAHGALGQALLTQGRFAEGTAATRRWLELLPANSPQRTFATQQLQRCERLLVLDDKLPVLRRGAAKPADVAERLLLAQVCQYKQLHATAARFAAEAFAVPCLADELRDRCRYSAACCAALAGCGQGKDAASLTAEERAHWRRQAQDWLRADLSWYAKRLDRGSAADRRQVQQQLQRWLADPPLVGVRSAAAIGKLPAAERAGWAELWAEAEALRRKARETR